MEDHHRYRNNLDRIEQVFLLILSGSMCPGAIS